MKAAWEVGMASQWVDRNRFLGGWIASALLLLIIAWIDARTSDELGFSAFYLLPIALATWFDGRRWGFLTACLALAAWLGADRVSGHAYSHPFYAFWAVLDHAITFFLFAGAFGWLVTMLRRFQQTCEDLSVALYQVKELKGLLPICAWCKNVRDDEGYWESIETYIASHTRASFSHGICPSCRDRYFPVSADGEPLPAETPPARPAIDAPAFQKLRFCEPGQ
jgi:hypothetical protein